MSRRSFLQLSSVSSLAISSGAAGLGATNALPASRIEQETGNARNANMQTAIREYLNAVTCRREEVEVFLDTKKPNWAKFDPELGYTLRDNIMKDGVDGSRTIGSFQKSGERRMINYADRPCRINTYGDSFTHCDQVSDGETWQECLAAHLGEPIRNFGIGGYGVYQAYRRMLREEEGPLAAQYVILNIWGVDDHLRSIDASRWLRVAEWLRTKPGHLYMFSGNPWVHVRLDLNTGRLVEEENSFNTPESLYKLTDPEFVYEHFRNDLVVKLLVAERNGATADLEELDALAKSLNVKTDLSSPEATAATARAVHLQYALRTGTYIVEKAQAFARGKNKKLMILLSYDSGTVMRACHGLPRPDQILVDFLKEKNILFFDALTAHVNDFKAFNLSPHEYVDRYYIGHYKPQGNHFFAFAIKDALVNWLEPKPIAYRQGSETILLWPNG
jgi:hypothetical protein